MVDVRRYHSLGVYKSLVTPTLASETKYEDLSGNRRCFSCRIVGDTRHSCGRLGLRAMSTTLITLLLTSLPLQNVDCEGTYRHPLQGLCTDDNGDIFLLPYFLGNGETGVYFAFSRDGLKFEWLNGGKVVMPAPPWGDESLTRDPSIVYHDGTFHMVWTTNWNSRSIGYAYSKDLVTWSEPKKIDIWGDRQDVRNTWAPELHWDPEKKEFLILWSSTTLPELNDGDGSEDKHGYDHRSYASRTKDFKSFTKPALFFSPQPEFSVIDPCIAHDDRGTNDTDDDRWVMVVKHELAEDQGGKNLRLTFSSHMQGPYETTLGPPIVGAGTSIVNRMGEGPSLFKRHGEWFLYWDAPGSEFSYCLATSRDLTTWKNRSAEMSLPAKQMRHGTVLIVPAQAVRTAP